MVCVNYITVSRQISFDWFRTPIEANDDWREEIYQDCAAPFIIHDYNGQRKGDSVLMGSSPNAGCRQASDWRQ